MMNKYKSKPITVDGYRFASKAEARRYGQLKLLKRAGRISELELQPKFMLQPKLMARNGATITAITYTADFQYLEEGRVVVEDVKGGRATQTALFSVKWRLFQAIYPWIEARIVEM